MPTSPTPSYDEVYNQYKGRLGRIWECQKSTYNADDLRTTAGNQTCRNGRTAGGSGIDTDETNIAGDFGDGDTQGLEGSNNDWA